MAHFEVGAGLPRPELSQLLDAETAFLLNKKGRHPKLDCGYKSVRILPGATLMRFLLVGANG